MRNALRQALGECPYVAVVAALACAALFPALFMGQAPIDVTGPLYQPPWQEGRPEGMGPPPDEASLEAERYFPWYAFLSHSAARGDDLFWNPLEHTGQPFLALWRTRALSPFSAPFYFLPPVAALTLSVLTKLLVAGLGAYYAARRLGMPKPIALWVGAAFELSVPVILWRAAPLSDVIVWTPLLLLFAEWLALGQWLRWPFGAITLGLMLLGGEPEAVGGAVLFCALLLAFRGLLGRGEETRNAVRGGAGLALAAVAGTGLAGAQILPYAEALPLLAATGQSAVAEVNSRAAGAALFLPLPRAAAHVAVAHAGLAPLMFLPVWWAIARFAPELQRRRLNAMLLSGGVLLVLAYALRPWFSGSWLGLLNPEHYLALHAIALAVFAGACAQEWLALDAEQCMRAVRRMVLPTGAFIAVLVAAGLSGMRLAQAGVVLPVVVTTGVALATLGLLAATLFRPSPAILGLGLAVVTGVNLWAAARPYANMTPHEAVFPETSFVRELAELGDRVAGSDTLRRWPLAANGIPQFYGTSGVALERYRLYLSRAEADPLLLSQTGSSSLLLTKRDIQGPFASLRSLLRIRRVFPSGAVLVEDLDQTGRAWLADEARPVDVFEPSSLRADEPPILEGGSFAIGDGGERAEVSVEQPRRNGEVTVRVADAGRSLLVLAEAWAPGWRATLNGAPVEVLPVNGVFQGVQLPQGDHEVVFRYGPPGWETGLLVSLVSGGAVLAGLLALGLVRYRANRKPTRPMW